MKTPLIQNNLTNATLWLSQEEINNLVTMSANIDPKWIRNAMVDVQLLYLRPCLGNKLYNEITGQIQTNTITILNETLRQTFGRSIAYYTIAKAIINGLRLRASNIGLSQNIDSTVNAGEKYDSASLRSELLHEADAFKAFALEWLIVNKASYPLFPQQFCCCHGANGGKQCGAIRNYFSVYPMRPSVYPQNQWYKYGGEMRRLNENPYLLFANDSECSDCDV